MSIGVVVGGVTVANVLAMKSSANMSVAAIVGQGSAGPLTPNGLPDPLVTGSVGNAAPGQTIILDPCTGQRR
jgi:hypothetical protein